MKTLLIVAFFLLGAVMGQAQSSITRNCATDNAPNNVVADGVTPDEGNIQTCIDNAIAAKQSHIQLPCGHILINRPINLSNRPGLRFSGCDSDESALNVPNTTVLVCNTGTFCIDMAGSGLTRLEDFTISAGSGTVGIIMGRDNATVSTFDPCFSENNEIDRVSVIMPNATSANGGVGTVAFYNAGGAERLTIINSVFQGNQGMYFATTNLFNILTQTVTYDYFTAAGTHVQTTFNALITGCDTAGKVSMTHVNLINVGIDLIGNGNGIYAATTGAFDLQNVDFVNGGQFACPINFATFDSGNWRIRAVYEMDLSPPVAPDAAMCVGVNLDQIDASVQLFGAPAGTTFGVIYAYVNNKTISNSRLVLFANPSQQFINNVPITFSGGELNINGTLAGSFSNVVLLGTLIHADTNLTFSSSSHYLMMNPSGITIH
jgi:hypothetical protein